MHQLNDKEIIANKPEGMNHHFTLDTGETDYISNSAGICRSIADIKTIIDLRTEKVDLEKERDELNKQCGEFQEGFFEYMGLCDHLQIEVDNLKKKMASLTSSDSSRKTNKKADHGKLTQSIDWNKMSELGLINRLNTEILHSLGLAISRNPETGCSEAILMADDGVWEYSNDIKKKIKPTNEEIISALNIIRSDNKCDCCDRGDEYNGFASGPLIFTCPKSCSCHD